MGDRRASIGNAFVQLQCAAVKKLSGVLVPAVAVLAALALVLVLLRPAVFDRGERTMDSTTIGAQFNDIAELATEEYIYSSVGKFDDEGLRVLNVRVPFTGKNFLVTYAGRVTAGIKDASEITVETDDVARTITVRLPQTEVLESTWTEGSSEVWDQTMNPINQITVEDVTEFVDSRRELEKQKAIDGGLLDRAQTRAEELARSHAEALIEGTNLEGYEVKVITSR